MHRAALRCGSMCGDLCGAAVVREPAPPTVRGEWMTVPVRRSIPSDEFYCPQAVAVIRLLMLTGCRFGEVVSLERDWIRGKRIHLPDAKSGPRTVWLSSAARAVIDAIPRYSPDCPFLFPARPPTRHIDHFDYQWNRIRNEAGLPGLRIHDLRHTAASQAVMSGEGLPLVGRLLGHNRHRTPAGYAHLADAHLVEAAEKVGAIIATAMASQRPRPITHRQ